MYGRLYGPPSNVWVGVYVYTAGTVYAHWLVGLVHGRRCISASTDVLPTTFAGGLDQAVYLPDLVYSIYCVSRERSPHATTHRDSTGLTATHLRIAHLPRSYLYPMFLPHYGLVSRAGPLHARQLWRDTYPTLLLFSHHPFFGSYFTSPPLHPLNILFGLWAGYLQAFTRLLDYITPHTYTHLPLGACRTWLFLRGRRFKPFGSSLPRTLPPIPPTVFRYWWLLRWIGHYPTGSCPTYTRRVLGSPLPTWVPWFYTTTNTVCSILRLAIGHARSVRTFGRFR